MATSTLPAKSTPHSVVSAWRAGFTTTAIGLAVALLAVLLESHPQPIPIDFEILWLSSRALLAGQNPYAALLARGADWPLYYPLPALVVIVPLALLPIKVAYPLFAGSAAAALWAAGKRYGRGLPIALLSAGFFEAIAQGQWSPLLTAAVVLPALAPVVIVKPSIGGALWAGFPSKWAVIGGLILLAVSFAVMPTWPVEWITSLGRANHIAPIFRPGGFILLLALLRWREPEARLLAALACVPQTTVLYETVPLFLIPRGRREGYALAVLTFIAAFAEALLYPANPGKALVASIGERWPVLLVCVYLPALLLVLRRPKSAEFDW